MAELSFQDSQNKTATPLKGADRAGLARFVALYFSLQFLTVLASLLIRVTGVFHFDPALDLGSEETESIEIQKRILPGILAQILAFVPGLCLIWLMVGKDAFLLGKLGNPFRLGFEFLLVSMGCHLVHQVALWLHQGLFGFTPQVHPFTKLGHSIDAQWIWFVLAFAACAAAPINEEIVFRRLTSLWLGGSFGKKSLFVMAGFFAIIGGSQSKTAQWQEQALPLIWVGFLYVLTLVFVSKGQTQWLIASASLFSAIHSFAWPSPIPLFFFGIYQAILMGRTGGILAPVLFHAWFNLLGVLVLLWDVYGT